MAGKQKRTSRTSTNGPSQDRILGRILLLVIWFLAGLYLGIASWAKIYRDALQKQAEDVRKEVDCSDPDHVGMTYDMNGVQLGFCTQEDFLVFQHEKQMADTGTSWIMDLPDPLPLILSAFSFGVVGSIVSLLRFLVNRQQFPDYYALSIAPIVGGVTALMLLGLTLLVPGIFTFTSKPEIQPFLSLFAGAFAEHIQKWFQSWVNKTFKIEKEKK